MHAEIIVDMISEMKLPLLSCSVTMWSSRNGDESCKEKLESILKRYNENRTKIQWGREEITNPSQVLKMLKLKDRLVTNWKIKKQESTENFLIINNVVSNNDND
jgi:phage-related tail protein